MFNIRLFIKDIIQKLLQQQYINIMPYVVNLCYIIINYYSKIQLFLYVNMPFLQIQLNKKNIVELEIFNLKHKWIYKTDIENIIFSNEAIFCSSKTDADIVDKIKTADLFIYSDLSVDNTTINRLLYKFFPKNFDYTPSTEKFISATIHLNNEKEGLQVYFKNDKFNYMIDGNVFDKTFISYLYQHRVDEIKTYKLSILDSNVNKVEIDETQMLIITKDGYFVANNEEIPTID
jgi:hypothetical protein